MSRPGRLALYLGTAVAVVGMSKLHAVEYGYSWSGSARFAWSLGYVVLLCIAAYACGLPEQPRTLRSAFLASVAAAALASLAVSVVQLFVGDAVLPRFVVLGSALVLVPWYVLCAVLARDAVPAPPNATGCSWSPKPTSVGLDERARPQRRNAPPSSSAADPSGGRRRPDPAGAATPRPRPREPGHGGGAESRRAGR